VSQHAWSASLAQCTYLHRDQGVRAKERRRLPDLPHRSPSAYHSAAGENATTAADDGDHLK